LDYSPLGRLIILPQSTQGFYLAVSFEKQKVRKAVQHKALRTFFINKNAKFKNPCVLCGKIFQVYIPKEAGIC
jgi:hypothetical protein